MTLKEKLQNDLNNAMKSKDEVKTSVLRMLKAAVVKFEVSGAKKHEATDEEVTQIIGKEVKQRKESIEAFKKGNREDLAVREEVEMKMLQVYMPEQMSEEELKKVVAEVIAQTGMSIKADFGKVMGAVMAKVKGKAEGAAVSKVVAQMLK